MHIGIGYDIHKLVDNNDLDFKLAGVKIPFHKKCVAHSDGDVAIHALIDALLGAATLGDIGTLFPDTHPQFKNADSAVLLQYCCDLIKKHSFIIKNIDINIITEKPKLAPYIIKMRERLAEILNIDINNISIKAKTNEQLDAIGAEKAIGAQAVALLQKRKIRRV